MDARKYGSLARRVVMLIAAFATLSVALAATVGVVVGFAGSSPTYTPGKLGKGGGPAITGQKGFSRCNEPGQPTCPPLPDTWTPLASEAPADVLAAMQACPDYMSPIQAFNLPSNATYSFDAPVLVLPATQGNKEYQYNLPWFIVRASVNGVRQVGYNLLYDPARHRIRLSGIGIMQPTDPNYGRPFPYQGVSASTAMANLHAARGLSIAAQSKPELVYFAPQAALPGQTSSWKGGGEDPADPIWRLEGSDGQPYFVGVDGKVYLPAQLPIAQGTSIVQP